MHGPRLCAVQLSGKQIESIFAYIRFEQTVYFTQIATHLAFLPSLRAMSALAFLQLQNVDRLRSGSQACAGGAS